MCREACVVCSAVWVVRRQVAIGVWDIQAIPSPVPGRNSPPPVTLAAPHPTMGCVVCGMAYTVCEAGVNLVLGWFWCTCSYSERYPVCTRTEKHKYFYSSSIAGISRSNLLTPNPFTPTRSMCAVDSRKTYRHTCAASNWYLNIQIRGECTRFHTVM